MPGEYSLAGDYLPAGLLRGRDRHCVVLALATVSRQAPDGIGDGLALASQLAYSLRRRAKIRDGRLPVCGRAHKDLEDVFHAGCRIVSPLRRSPPEALRECAAVGRVA